MPERSTEPLFICPICHGLGDPYACEGHIGPHRPSATEPLTDSIREIGVIRPGDTLLLSTDRRMTAEEVGKIHEAIKDEMPGIKVVIITGLTAIVKRASDD